MARIKRTAGIPFEEDVLTEITQKVVNVLNMYAESYDAVRLSDPREVRRLAATFVTKVVEYERGEDELLHEVKKAADKYRRKPDHRQLAVQLVNVAYDVAWQFYQNSDAPNVDDLIEAKTNEIISETGVDVNAVNTLVDSIY